MRISLHLHAVLLLAITYQRANSATDTHVEVSSSGRPNVLLIYTDDHAQWAVGAYGNKDVYTPHIDRLAADAHAAYTMLDDNSAILGSWAWGVVGRDLRGASQRLAASGRLHDADHTWGLAIDEILGLLRGQASPSPAAAADAHARWRSHAALEPPANLNGDPAPPPDPSVFPDPVGRLVAAFGMFLNDKFNDAGTTQGIGAAPVTGRAVVVDCASDALDRIEAGDILVTSATTPAYNGVLGMVGGIVVSTGGPSSHAAVVARELGIPAIVGYADATSTIPDGTTITLDPVAATVRIG